ncbi:MAG: bifunctional phosphoribosyl-AMP cyclohydrolase/phosphoribosyl-ATP diphosphatase HisIE [Lachnospiraceae bacterium]|nr:bifunctional phosphoribosyl-AMP cyclohydrolase/phosphoribosyl-ATP diphosphatase HisIE [Lachnospiraceae bacterium]
MEMKKIVPYINAENEARESIIKKAAAYEQSGADGLFIYNYSMSENEREEFLHTVKQIVKECDIPVLIGCYVKRFEDIKKALYTGAEQVVTPYVKLADKAVIKEGADRFGKDKIVIEIDATTEKNDSSLQLSTLAEEVKGYGAAGLLIKHITLTEGVMEKVKNAGLPVIIRDSLLRNDMEALLSMENVTGVATNYYEKKSIYKIKQQLKAAGVPVETWDSSVSFEQLKKNADGMVPVIVQDYKNNEVLMLAYMNEEAYNKTIETGRMTYYSRSREKLWIKGEESGHFQYVKSLSIDCDNDTILAKVMQVGAACHTGNRSCFYRDLVKKSYEDMNPATVFQEVYDTILDRKENPKEGSYTNYLFDKGIDKILKKCGEEAAEIIIAAKNPDPEEIKYEIADFLYHMMVLMAERGVDWEDITRELAHRH